MTPIARQIELARQIVTDAVAARDAADDAYHTAQQNYLTAERRLEFLERLADYGVTALDYEAR